MLTHSILEHILCENPGGTLARRVLIENNGENETDFFHTDALSPAVAVEVNCD
jgi:hypothetical protein